MSTQHEALRHADLLSKEVWPANMTLARWADKSAETIRTQHALIVQMAEAIQAHKDCEFNSDHPALQSALEAAKDYLK